MLWFGRERNFLNINEQQNGTCPCQRSIILSWQSTSFRFPKQRRQKLTICNGKYHKHGWRHYYSFREANINFNIFFHRLVFFITCLCCTVLKFKCSYSKYSLFLHTFSRKMSAYLDRAKKKVKSLKIENFDQTSEKWAPPNSGQFWPNSKVSAIQRFDCILKSPFHIPWNFKAVKEQQEMQVWTFS